MACKSVPQKIIEGSNGISDLLASFTMGSDWMMDPKILLDHISHFGIHAQSTHNLLMIK